MSIKSVLDSTLSQLLTSNRILQWHRRRYGQLRELEFFHKLDDPYSLLLLKELPKFLRRFGLQVKITLVQELPQGSQADPERLAQYALYDAPRLAAYYGVSWYFPAQAPSREDVDLVARVLLSDEELGIDDVLVATESLWAGKMTAFYELAQAGVLITSEEAQQKLHGNCAALLKKGHYQGAMIACGGEWYWGLDRLGHLEQRLLEQLQGISKPLYDKQYQHFLKEPQNNSADSLTFYFSFRSPYSYLALERAKEFAVAYELDLDIRPVLPMVMRGLAVPRVKRLYILRDAKREADAWGIPFGNVCDPLGKGVEHAMALFKTAEKEGKAYRYCLTLARAVWTNGLDIASEKVLQTLVEDLGLDWPLCKSQLKEQSWREWAEQHQQEMLALGSWGVPTFRLGDCVVWGQDRFWALEQAVES